MKYFIVSKGYVEDQLGCRVYQQLRLLCPDVNVFAFPLASQGFSYAAYDIPLYCSDLRLFRLDLNLSFLKRFRSICRFLWLSFQLFKQRKEYDFIFSVGQSLPLWVAIFSGIRPIYCLPTLKSGKASLYSGFFLALMKYFVSVNYPHSSLLTRMCQNKGLRSLFLGNPLLEGVRERGEPFNFDQDKGVLAFMPGIQEGAYDAFLYWLDFMTYLEERCAPVPFHFILSKAPILHFERFVDVAQCKGWVCRNVDQVLCFQKGDMTLFMSEYLIDVIKSVDLVVSLSASVAEQALDLGKPVVSFPGFGRQTGYNRLKKQVSYAGDRLCLLPKRDYSLIWQAIQDVRDLPIDQDVDTMLQRLPSQGIAMHLLKDLTGII